MLQIEAVRVPGRGKLVPLENSAMAKERSVVEFFIKSRLTGLRIDIEELAKHDIHVHVPEGATPKDGPSAGVAMATSIISAVTGIEVRRDVAMTGEITLRGRVLPIGGLKEKLFVALRGGLKTVVIPKERRKIWRIYQTM